MIDRLAVEFGAKILEIVPGRVSTEVDARLSFDTAATIDEGALTSSRCTRRAGIERERVLIKIASTWEGIRAAEMLEKEGIHCNLTLLFGMHQAVACAEAEVTLISPFVGRILDWYKKADRQGRATRRPRIRACVSCTRIYNYYKKLRLQDRGHGRELPQHRRDHRARRLRPAHHRPDLLAELPRATGTLVRASSTRRAAQQQTFDTRIYDEPRFRSMHDDDPMATDKLAEGIRTFASDAIKLEKLIGAMQ